MSAVIKINESYSQSVATGFANFLHWCAHNDTGGCDDKNFIALFYNKGANKTTARIFVNLRRFDTDSTAALDRYSSRFVRLPIRHQSR